MLRTLACVALAGAVNPAHAASTRIVQDGFENPCQADSDGDRLVNCIESTLLTDPFDADTDSDGLDDGDEVLGTRQGLDLPSFGVSPLRKTLLLEIDWTDDKTGCAWHTHRPSTDVVAQVQAFFASLPVENPDGTQGIELIADYGQGSPFSGGGYVATATGIASLQELQQKYQPANFDPKRGGYFRYALHAHKQSPSSDHSGVSAGDAHLVTLQCQGDTPGYLRNTIIHEVGHNLGLQHGGDSNCNDKPNYNSLMNYQHQFYGLDVDCDRFSDGVDFIGFSDGSRRTLDKKALVESDGVCPASHPQWKPFDWNHNQVIDPQPVAATMGCAWLDVLADWNDIAALRLPLSVAPNAGQTPPPPAGEACAPPPELENPP